MSTDTPPPAPATATPPASSTPALGTTPPAGISSSRSSSRRRAAADEHNARSFSRLEPSPSRSLKSTHTHPLVTDILIAENSDGVVDSPLAVDEGERTPMSAVLPERFDELPAEIIALTDRFLESLTAKTHPAPLTVQQLSSLFQDFYAVAAQQISSHVSSLYLALKSKNGASARTQQLLSIEEIAQKRRDRRALEIKRLAIEEAVEKRVTEAVYERIWRHRSSEDEPRDEMLRSKIQALNVVGVKLSHLGMEGVEDGEMMRALKTSREALVRLKEEKSPLGKLNVLREIHKNIVDVLSTNSSTSGQHSSADSILPTLIFTLLHSPANTTVLSDLLFIQRFRCSSRLDGEAAYCLTNLEASISFLETVDLASLHLLGDGKEDVKERWPTLPAPDGPTSPTKVATDIVSEPSAPLPAQVSTTDTKPATLILPDTTPKPPTAGGLSLLTPVEFVGTTVVAAAGHGIGLGSTVVSTADQSLKTLGSTLESSYRFLLGKMQSRTDVSVPKTLEDARKLVDHPPEAAEADLSTLFTNTKDTKDTHPTSTPPLNTPESSQPLARTSSQASTTSTTSLRPKPKPKPTPPLRPPAHTVSSAPLAAGFAAVGSIGSSLGKFAGLGIKGLQRATGSGHSTPASSPAPAPAAQKDPITISISTARANEEGRESLSGRQEDLLTAFPDLVGVLPGKKREKPEVVERFLRVEAGELRVGEVEGLLREYRRLAEWVGGEP